MDWVSMLDLEAIFKILLAFILSGIIGAQREIHNKPAGFRPHVIVGVSAAACVLAGQKLALTFGSDAARIPAQLITGIGFIGAGTILADGFNVKGLNTASSLLGVTCIGLVVGAEAYFVAIFTTLLLFIVLAYSKKIFPNSVYHDHVRFVLSMKYDAEVNEKIEKVFAKNTMLIDKISTYPEDENDVKKIKYICKYKNTLAFNKVITELSAIDGVIGVEMITEKNIT